ncbi:hypothetical protein E2C01_044601 [Portunus trituberculatus]|uniref:Uncharacterized protein n=1 Tax=Portunus trituberculatus TaxID=210409 RepID=A0A5B7FZS9_PORTR|nr:hypothetical protein [Portunus trituberculatus]
MIAQSTQHSTSRPPFPPIHHSQITQFPNPFTFVATSAFRQLLGSANRLVREVMGFARHSGVLEEGQQARRLSPGPPSLPPHRHRLSPSKVLFCKRYFRGQVLNHASEANAKGVEESKEKMSPRAGYAVLRKGRSVGTRKPRVGLNVITVFISLHRHHPHRAKPGPLATSDGGGAGDGGGREGEETKWEEIDGAYYLPIPSATSAFAPNPTPVSSCYTVSLY